MAAQAATVQLSAIMSHDTMDAQDDESSGCEVQDNFMLGSKLGKKSVDTMIDNAICLRKDSKNAVRTLDPFGIAPGTRDHRQRAVVRLNEFRSELLKHEDLNKPFTVEDFIRFIDTMLKVIAPRSNSVLSLKFVLCTIADCLVWAKFQYKDFMKGFHAERLKAYIQGLVRDKKVISGVSRERVWLAFSTVNRITREWFNHAITKGTTSMDVTVFRAMSVNLCSSMGIRAGDIALTKMYKNEYTRLSNVRIHFKDNAKDYNVGDLRMVVDLPYMKGHKFETGTATIKHHAALSEANAHMCPIRLLLIHALRNGLVRATSLTQLLKSMAMRNDQTLVWQYPDYPLICAISRTISARLILDKPGQAAQVNDSVQQMGAVSGILAHVYTHTLRMGYARDVAHLPDTMLGSITTAAREALNHKLNHDPTVTGAYIGGLSNDINSLREANSHNLHKREPKFAEVVPSSRYKADVDAPKQSHFTDKECIEFFAERWPKGLSGQTDYRQLSKAQQSTVKTTLKRKQRSNYIYSADAESQAQKKAKLLAAPPMPSADNVPRQVSVVQGAATGQSSSAVPMAADPDLNIDPQLLADGTSSRPAAPTTNVSSCPMPSDKQADVLMDLMATVVANDELSNDQIERDISAAIDIKEKNVVRVYEDDASNVFDDFIDPHIEPVSVSSEDFVEQYSRYNICKIDTYGITYDAAGGDELMIQSTGTKKLPVMIGNSRDFPQPWVYRCHRQGCTRVFHTRPGLDDHVVSCNPARRAELLSSERGSIPCPKEGCSRVIKAVKGQSANIVLNAHIREFHEFEPIECPYDEACDSRPKLFTNYRELKYHKTQCHTEQVSCPVSNCEKKMLMGYVTRHLHHAHTIYDKDEIKRLKATMPQRVAAEKKKFAKPRPKYQPAQCHLCPATPQSRFNHLKHLCKIHGMSEAVAELLAPPKAACGGKTKTKNQDRVANKNFADDEAANEDVDEDDFTDE